MLWGVFGIFVVDVRASMVVGRMDSLSAEAKSLGSFEKVAAFLVGLG